MARRTSRAGLDARHGRQGGRVVPWRDMPGPYELGDVVALDLGEWNPPTVPLEVVHVYPPAGRYAGLIRIRWPSGSEVICSPDHVSPFRGKPQ